MSSNHAHRREFSHLSVLVIDDQEHVRRWIVRVLKGLGITVIAEAEDGAAALARLTAPDATFDIILCDLRMPDTDGIELIRAFAAMQIDTPVILVSMEPERVLETSALLAEERGLHVVGTIAKPVSEEKLVPLLRVAMPKSNRAARHASTLPRETMRDTLQDGALYLHYQPKIVMNSGRMTGVEALVRWNHPEHGHVGPDEFVSLCEESPALGDWLFDYTVTEAIAFAARWSDSEQPLSVAVNVHAGAFDDLELPDRLEGLVGAAGVSASRITFELTERSVASDAVRMLDVATRLRLKGFGLAIDDFGTGHSGLSQLRRLPFNQLKIDRQFVHGATESRSKRSVVEASVALARNLQMTSVAEGIERRPEWDLLQSLGCEEMQGFFTGRPMSEAGLQAWATHWNLDRPAPPLAS